MKRLEHKYSYRPLFRAILMVLCVVCAVAFVRMFPASNINVTQTSTFRTENLFTDHNSTLGGSAADLTAINSSMLVGSNAQFSAGTRYTIGGQTPTTTTQLAIVASDTHTAYEAIQLLIYNIAGSYDTTAQPSTYWGVDSELEVNHSVGSNALTVAAYHCSAQIVNAGSADSAECMSGTAGGGIIDIRDGADFGGLTHVGGFGGTSQLVSTGVDINNFALGSATSILDVNPSAPIFVTGFVNPTPTIPRFLTLCNRNDTFRMIVSPADGGSTAANQIFSSENFSGGSFPGYWIMSPRQCIDFKYDVAISRWVMRSSSGFTFPYVQVANHANAGVPGAKWQSSTGDPNGVFNCAVGDIFSRTDGGTSTSLYTCTAANTWTATSPAVTTVVATGHVDSATGLFTKETGFVGNPEKNGTGDWTLQYATALNTDQGLVLGQVQDQGGAATRMNLTIQSIDTTHIRVRTFSNGTASDQHFWIELNLIN